MAIALSTAGTIVSYAVETTAGTKPATGFTKIPGVTSIGDMNPEPNQIDVTPLEEPEWKQYIPGLKDIGGNIAFGANNTDAFQTAWAALVEAAKTASESDKATWFQISIPGLDNAFFFTGTPVSLGLSGIEVDTGLSIDAYVTPNKVTGWAAKVPAT